MVGQERQQVIVQVGQERFVLGGRAAALVGLVVCYADRLNALDRGTLEVHMYGENIDPEIREILPRQKAPRSPLSA